MAKKKSNDPKRPKRSQEAFPSIRDDETNYSAPQRSDSRRWFLITVFLVIALGGTYLAQALKGIPNVEIYGFEKIKEYPHDPGAFTQGLLLDNGIIYESTGKYDGQSSIRKSALETGDILKKVTLDAKHFGEGLARVDDLLYQLTWKEKICHVYDLELNKVKQFKYQGQGWGLTYDGTHLIMSDGSSQLHFIDPKNFESKRVITVKLGNQRIAYLNELEYSNQKIYANRLDRDKIYEIEPSTGQVEAIIDLAGLWPDQERPREGVLNGIAIDEKNRKLVVTGKYCPKIFEIELKLRN